VVPLLGHRTDAKKIWVVGAALRGHGEARDDLALESERGETVADALLDFWRRVIADYTGGRYEEARPVSGWKGLVQTFSSAGGPVGCAALE
jgi:hypothetical protein